jgi:hypothetical protein
MAANIVLQRALAARTISGNPPQTLVLPEAASQTFKKGEFVYLVAGYVTEIADATPDLILGMAAEDAHNGDAGAYNVGVYIANADTIFKLNKVSAGGSGTGGTIAATAVTDVGKAFALYRDTTNNITHAVVAEGALGAQRQLICIDHAGDDVLLDVGGRLLCIVNGKYRQLYCTS